MWFYLTMTTNDSDYEIARRLVNECLEAGWDDEGHYFQRWNESKAADIIAGYVDERIEGSVRWVQLSSASSFS